eukprot:COSAG02_NODE_3001_length_7578_cov_2.926461_5_plen_107_part_00
MPVHRHSPVTVRACSAADGAPARSSAKRVVQFDIPEMRGRVGLNLRLGYQNADVNFVDLILSVYISGEMFYHHRPLALLLVPLPKALLKGLTWSNAIAEVWWRQIA